MSALRIKKPKSQKYGFLWWIGFFIIVVSLGIIFYQPVVNLKWRMILVQVPQVDGSNWYVVHDRGITHIANNVMRDRGYHWYDNSNGISFVKEVDGLPSMTAVHLDEISFGPLDLYEYPLEDGSEVLWILSDLYSNSLPYLVKKVDGTTEVRWFS